ncbi:MAG: SprT-like domain-containing protein [Planctomycetia bacterium]
MSPIFGEQAIWPRLPPATHRYVAELLACHPVDVRVSRPRRTKLGDHRGPSAVHRRHRISVNDGLNPYAFFTTLLHEIAHAATWDRHGPRRRRVRPHGPEWKAEFERILMPVVSGRLLPDDVGAALERSMRNPPAATCSDRDLMLALARYDRFEAGVVFVESLPEGTVFRTDDGREFLLGPKLRSRHRCIERRTGLEYRMHPLCRVTPVEDAPARRSGRTRDGSGLYRRALDVAVRPLRRRTELP